MFFYQKKYYNKYIAKWVNWVNKSYLDTRKKNERRDESSVRVLYSELWAIPNFQYEKRIGTSFNLVCSYGHPAEKGFDILPIKKRKPNDFG